MNNVEVNKDKVSIDAQNYKVREDWIVDVTPIDKNAMLIKKDTRYTHYRKNLLMKRSDCLTKNGKNPKICNGTFTNSYKNVTEYEWNAYIK